MQLRERRVPRLKPAYLGIHSRGGEAGETRLSHQQQHVFNTYVSSLHTCRLEVAGFKNLKHDALTVGL